MITGGCGFIGSNLIQYWRKKYPDDRIVNLDDLTYAARPNYLKDFSIYTENYKFVKCNIQDQAHVSRVMQYYKPDHVIHLAAESHVCRSINGPRDFVHTNILGTFNLIEEFRALHPTREAARFHHVSTDEVYGQVEEPLKFSETSNYSPRSPYAASKAASDMLVKAYKETYGMNTVITNCSNNFGPNQHEEKLIPKAILSFNQNKPMSLYGDGRQVRDWLYVMDHCAAIDTVFHKGTAGETYCVGGDMEMTNRDIVTMVTDICRDTFGYREHSGVVYTNDRPTDDLRYAIDASKIKGLGWHVDTNDFKQHLTTTVKWYAQCL